jgi:Tol biopolymer transport system component
VRRWLLPLSLTALTAAAVGVAVWNLKPSLPRPVVTRLALSTPEGALTSLGRNLITVSPDGTRLVYYIDGRPVLRDLSEFESRAVPGGFGRAVFSPDGQSLAVYSAADNTIKRLEVGGSAAVTVCRSDDVFGMTWDTSGIISGQGAKGIFRCRTDGSAPEQIATVENDEEADQPQILPDGKAVLFTVAKIVDGPTRWDTARIVVQSLTSPERKVLVDGGSSSRYIRSGHILYARGGIVFAVPFDAARREITGRAVGVVEGVSRSAGVTGGAHFTVSNTGHLFYISGPASTASNQRAIALADRAGVVTRLPVPPGPYVNTRVSRDGRSLAVGTDDGKEAAIWIYQLDGKSAMRRLTLEGRNQFPIWSPDGERVAFQSDRGGDRAIYVQRVDGSSPAVRLTKPEAVDAHVPESWSPDGRYILFSLGKGSTFTLWSLSVADGKAAPLGVTSQNTTGAVFSPDGKWIAYSAGSGVLGSNDGGVFVQPFPVTGSVYPAPRAIIDFHPVWAPDGKELIYVASAGTGQLVSVKVAAQAGLTFGTPVTSPARVTAGRIAPQTRAHDIMPDGRFVGLIDPAQTEVVRRASEIRVVFNWFEELKARVQPNR